MDTYTTPRQYIRTLLGVLLGVSIVASSTAAGAEAQFSFEGLSPQQQVLVDEAVGLYAEAGLELPQVRFTATDDTSECEGRAGIARRKKGHTQIVLCTTEAGPADEWLIIHELAHAWDYHNLTDDTKTAFSELRGTTSWLGRDVEWHERGGEHAAEIMVWALIDRPIDLVRISNTSCADLHEAYKVLTGSVPLHGYEDHC